MLLAALLIGLAGMIFPFQSNTPLQLRRGSRLMLVGGNLCSRMMNYGSFETELHVRYPDSLLYIRNMCDGGDTPGFRPHAGRNNPWAFPGAEKFYPGELRNDTESEGFVESPDQWLTRLGADIVVGFFGFSESFAGKEGLTRFQAELRAFLRHSRHQRYNGLTPPQLALVSPIAFEDLSGRFDVPSGLQENENLLLYTQVMQAVAEEENVLFVDAFTPSKQWYADTDGPLTIDGSQLNEAGYQKLALLLADRLFGPAPARAEARRAAIRAAVLEKNYMWHNDFKMPNGVHVFGRRYNPFGPDNYPYEIVKVRQMTAVRDTALWAAGRGLAFDRPTADARTLKLPPVSSNFNPEKNGNLKYRYGNDALQSLKVAPGFKIELFASEAEFPDLANPVQMSFDAKGRLWVSTMPSYPHYRPGDPRPNDKILILEDTNGDNRADTQTVFADSLHLPLGFEIAAEGVYVSQGTNLKLLTDTNGDDRADRVEILLSGFDDHDTHHNSHAFTVDPSGAIYSGEGVFLHTNVETSYGPVRAANGGFYRYSPQLKKLERTAQLEIPNPWGIAFDDWGQPFFAETSSPDVRWMLPGSVLPRYGDPADKSKQLIEEAHRVRPTSGLEFVSSRHFPDHLQGDLLINNTIGFLGMKEHTLNDDGTGYKSHWRQDLLVSDDRNFRPVDMEFAPDGSLYVIDWHNILIGHMQHNARDPLRDHVHGRIYRITYPSRPLLTPAPVAGASVTELFGNLKLPEYRTRYRTRRELRSRPPAELTQGLKAFVAGLDPAEPRYEHHLLEALWVSWGMNRVDQPLLRKLLKAKDFNARAAAVQVLRYVGHQVSDQPQLLRAAAADPNSRVRLTALVAASWLGKEKGLPVLAEAARHPLDDWMKPAYDAALAHLNGLNVRKKKEPGPEVPPLAGEALTLFQTGKTLFSKEGYCITCHQPDGKGLPASGFPPLTGTEWVTGSPERLIKLVLNGLLGPIDVAGRSYPGQVPMTPFGGLMKDDEVAAVLTYVRNAFGNRASAILPEQVRKVRAATATKTDFYSPAALLKQHPLETKQ